MVPREVRSVSAEANGIPWDIECLYAREYRVLAGGGDSTSQRKYDSASRWRSQSRCTLVALDTTPWSTLSASVYPTAPCGAFNLSPSRQDAGRASHRPGQRPAGADWKNAVAGIRRYRPEVPEDPLPGAWLRFQLPMVALMPLPPGWLSAP